MRIRSVEERDRVEWLRLRCTLWPNDKSAHAVEIDRFLAGPLREPNAVLAAADGEKLVGLAEVLIRVYAEGCAIDQVGYLEGWYVDPAARKQGLWPSTSRCSRGLGPE